MEILLLILSLNTTVAIILYMCELLDDHSVLYPRVPLVLMAFCRFYLWPARVYWHFYPHHLQGLQPFWGIALSDKESP